MTVDSSKPKPGPPNAAGNPTVICGQCDPPKPVTAKNLKAHQRNVHGGVTVGTRAFKPRAAAKKARVTSVAAVRAEAGLSSTPIVLTPTNGAGKTSFRVLDNFVVLAGSDGHIYVAERIK